MGTSSTRCTHFYPPLIKIILCYTQNLCIRNVICRVTKKQYYEPLLVGITK